MKNTRLMAVAAAAVLALGLSACGGSASNGTGVYDCEVTNQRGENVAVFRGRSYTVKGKPSVAD